MFLFLAWLDFGFCHHFNRRCVDSIGGLCVCVLCVVLFLSLSILLFSSLSRSLPFSVFIQMNNKFAIVGVVYVCMPVIFFNEIKMFEWNYVIIVVGADVFEV